MRSVASLAVFAFVLAAQQPAQAQSIEGSWEGPIKIPSGQTLRLRLNITKTPDGALKATTDSPDQGAFGIPIDSITLEGRTLRWSLKQLQASYEGILNDAGTEIAGKLTQGMALDLVLKRLDPSAAKGPLRPQEPRPPFPYASEDLTFPSKAAGVALAGTLTLPQGKGPHPAVILLTGSGPQDRNEAIMGHKPFLVLADHLTRQGIAVLRFDDRGFGKSTGTFTTATSADFSDDAEGAFDYLAKRPEIDPKRIGFAGHSEGGIIAPMVAARRADVAFLVLMAGTGVTGEQVMYEQSRAINKAAGAPEEAARKNRELQQKLFAAIREEADPAKLQIRLQTILEAEPMIPEAQRMAQVRQVSSPWFRFFVVYDPAPALEKVKCPVLAINGALDLQVDPAQNLVPIAAALRKGGNRQAETVELPGLNHLFQTAKTGLPAEYARIEETMSPKAMEAISTWIRKRTGLASQ